MLNDSRTAMEIHLVQRAQEKQLSEQMIKELEAHLNFLHIELEEKNKLIKNIVPECENSLMENTNVFVFNEFNSL